MTSTRDYDELIDRWAAVKPKITELHTQIDSINARVAKYETTISLSTGKKETKALRIARFGLNNATSHLEKWTWEKEELQKEEVRIKAEWLRIKEVIGAMVQEREYEAAFEAGPWC